MCCFVLICFINPRVRKIRNETSSYPGIFSRTLRFYYVANSPFSPLSHLLDGNRKLLGSSAIPARSYPGPVRYHWGSIVELEVSSDETQGLMTLQPHNTNVSQSTHMQITIPTRQIQFGTKKLMLLTRAWLVLPDTITLQWESLIDTSSPLSVGAPAIDRVWALPPCSTLGWILVYPSLGALAIEFGHSHQVWALLRVDLNPRFWMISASVM